MIFSIDITECFGAIDSDNAGGIISCISIPPIENPQEKFRLKLSNFVLNLIDGTKGDGFIFLENKSAPFLILFQPLSYIMFLKTTPPASSELGDSTK